VGTHKQQQTKREKMRHTTRQDCVEAYKNLLGAAAPQTINQMLEDNKVFTFAKIDNNWSIILLVLQSLNKEIGA
tara:strand:- start:293 stop:514 length:222 start_codon:yes stop_codon:yes gene_type:complete